MSITEQPNPSSLRLHLREIISHGGVFGIGLLVSRLTSIVLLPVYTRVLSPADYGVLAILDLVGEALRLAISTGLTSAAGRFHFDDADERRRSQVWWTALVALVGLTTLTVVPLAALRSWLAGVTFGSEIANGRTLYLLMLASFWWGVPEGLFQNHLRATKRSRPYVIISLARLFVNAGLNIMFLYGFGWGVAGVLWGNLITGAAWTLLHLGVFSRIRGQVSIDRTMLRPMLHFGTPLMIVALLSLGMHQLDRYVLLQFVTLEAIGIYSLAYQIGQGVNSLVLSPFSQIWSVVVFEIAAMSQAKRVFAEIFRVFVRGLLLVLLAASLGAGLAVRVLAPPEYAPAANLIPVIALAYFFFSLDDHFRVPALIHKQTVALIPVYAVAVALNLALNLLLVPPFGAAGAAWASVGTFAGFVFVGLRRYRRIDRIEYPLRQSAEALAAAIGVYVVYRWVAVDLASLASLAFGGGLWVALAVVFLRQPLQAWRQRAH